MLALKRKLDQVIELVIPGRPKRIKLTVLEIQGRHVRLGIEADRDIEIVRPDCPMANRRRLKATA